MPRKDRGRARRIFPVKWWDSVEVEKAFRSADKAIKDTNLDLDVAFEDIESNESEMLAFSWMGF